jgi:hypothetical protein
MEKNVNRAISMLIDYLGNENEFSFRDSLIRNALAPICSNIEFPLIHPYLSNIIEYSTKLVLAMDRESNKASSVIIQTIEQKDVTEDNPIFNFEPFGLYTKQYREIFSKIKSGGFLIHISIEKERFKIWNCSELWKLMQKFNNNSEQFRMHYSSNQRVNAYVHVAKFEPVLIALNFLIAVCYHCRITGKSVFSFEDLKAYSDRQFPALDYRFLKSSLGSIKYATSDFLGRFYDLPTTGGKAKKAKLFENIFEGSSKKSLRLLIPLEQISIDISPRKFFGFGLD